MAIIAIDITVESPGWPPEAELRALAERAAGALLAELALTPPTGCELSLLFTDDAHMQVLNRDWRGKDRATNVLSFPAFPATPDAPLPPMLGDIVLARETVAREAHDEGKPFGDHLSHLLVHGLLHLLGHDHEQDGEAEIMEALEVQILSRLAIPDPYA